MTRIVETAQILERPDALWKEIGQFGAVGQRPPFLSKVDSERERPGEQAANARLTQEIFQAV